MKLKYQIFLIGGYIALLAILLIPEIVYQQTQIIPAKGSFAFTFRLAIILHLVFYAITLALVYLGLLVSGQKEKSNKVLLTGTVLATMLIAEIIVRAGGSVVNYGEQRKGYYLNMYQQPFNYSPYQLHLPNSVFKMQTREFSYTRNINSLGFSFNEVPEEKKPGEIRIMSMGDSFTEGDGAPADSTWMKIFQTKLQAAYPDSNFTFINAGVCGSDPVFDYNLFVHKLEKYKPDYLIDVVTNSDMDDIGLRGGFERFIGEDSCRFKQGPWWEPVYAVSHLFRLIVHTHRNRLFLTPKEDEARIEKSAVTINRAERMLDSIAAERQIKFVCVLMPVATDFLNNEFSTLKPVMQKMQQPVFNVFNLFPCYAGKINSQNVFNYYWQTDGHHNSQGYKLFGECMAGYFVENKFVESRTR
jgi:hypothetical protein